jgi:hypothetical protein
MRVRVNKPRQHNTPERVYHLSLAIDQCLDLTSAANALDQSVANKHSTVCDDPELTQLRTSARTCRTSQGHELRAVNNSDSLTFFF